MSDITPRERIIETALRLFVTVHRALINGNHSPCKRLRLFYRQGYLATGINQIIAESNVAKATFYSHFSSKEALCVAYLQARHGIWMQWLQESVEEHDTAKMSSSVELCSYYKGYGSKPVPFVYKDQAV